MEAEIDVIREGQEQDIVVGKQNYTIGFFPSGELNITQNGEYDVNQYASVNAQVSPVLQDKEVTITSNGTQTIQTDEGYEGINSVSINSAVVPNLQNKEVSILTNGTQIIQKDEVYDGLGTVTINAEIEARVVLPDQIKFKESYAYDFTFLKYCDTSNMTKMDNMFYNCYNAEIFDFSSFDISKVTTMTNMFYNSTKITSLDLSSFRNNKLTTISRMFYGLYKLTDLNIDNFDLSSLYYSYQFTAFEQCGALNNVSLNSILKALSTNSRNFSGKTLKNCGLSSTQATTCTTLSNWQACVNAGWTTGY